MWGKYVSHPRRLSSLAAQLLTLLSLPSGSGSLFPMLGLSIASSADPLIYRSPTTPSSTAASTRSCWFRSWVLDCEVGWAVASLCIRVVCPLLEVFTLTGRAVMWTSLCSARIWHVRRLTQQLEVVVHRIHPLLSDSGRGECAGLLASVGANPCLSRKGVPRAEDPNAPKGHFGCKGIILGARQAGGTTVGKKGEDKTP